MTAEDVLTQVRARGYRLTLRPGGLRLTSSSQPTDDVRLLIADHRAPLMALLEAEDRAWSLHEASLAAGRVTTFPVHLMGLVHPSLRVLLDAETSRTSRTVVDRRPNHRDVIEGKHEHP